MKESNKVFPSLAQAAAAVREGAFGTAAVGEKAAQRYGRVRHCG